MSVESLKNQNENLTQKDLLSLKETLEQKNKPWVVNYLRESKDGKYNIYSYILAQWWTKWWIKNKYINQIWQWIEWTQFTDANWNEIKKDKFNAWERVFLRVPKKKETINQKERKNTPWKIEYIWNKKDKQNRNWKFYSYTFAQWWNIWGAMNKFDSQLWKDTRYERYCDMNWNKLKKEWFNKWETIYYKEPNTDIIDPTPEMTINEIMKISDNNLYQIVEFEDWTLLNKVNYIRHCDRKWRYIIINGKKLYYGHSFQSDLKENTPYIEIQGHEGFVDAISIFVKKWGKYQWVITTDPVYRWELYYDRDYNWLEPKK